MWSTAPAPPLLVSSQDVHSTRHGNRHCLLGVAAGSSCWSGSTGNDHLYILHPLFSSTPEAISLMPTLLSPSTSLCERWQERGRWLLSWRRACSQTLKWRLILWPHQRRVSRSPALQILPLITYGWRWDLKTSAPDILVLILCFAAYRLMNVFRLVSRPEVWDRQIFQRRSSRNLRHFVTTITVPQCRRGK